MIESDEINTILESLKQIGYNSNYRRVDTDSIGFRIVGEDIINKLIAAWMEEIII